MRKLLLAAILLAIPLAVFCQRGSGGLRVTTDALPDGPWGQPYSFQLTAQGGKLPYHWSVIQGQLPIGMTLSDGGLLSGTPVPLCCNTPTNPGVFPFSFTVQVQDSSGQAATVQIEK